MWLAVLDDAFGYMSGLVALDAFDFKSTLLSALERLVISGIARMRPSFDGSSTSRTMLQSPT
ncbi:hypothetical protein EXIGLDRAFT_717244, partial [Exidia glandulosa HHB12029]